MVGDFDFPALLAFADGSIFFGKSKGYGDVGEAVVGEVVFNTALTGYQEILTDPSYHSQIINFTHPHIGNTGINQIDAEATTIFAKGLIARNICTQVNHWRATQTLPEFLNERKIVAIDEIDTRAVTRHLRDQGALAGCIMVLDGTAGSKRQEEVAVEQAKQFAGLKDAMLAEEASGYLPVEWHDGQWLPAKDCYETKGNTARHVVVIDCGAKKNILRQLTARGCRVSVLPYRTTVDELLALQPDGVLLSNGPGDPTPCHQVRELAVALLAQQIPLFGLCLGHQIVSVALGASVEKMKFGHHGANHPVRAEDGRILITSQNHGFAVRADSLPENVHITHVSLFDGSLQGLSGQSPPVMTFQGHPEAAPGPSDAGVLFDDFICLIDNAKAL